MVYRSHRKRSLLTWVWWWLIRYLTWGDKLPTVCLKPISRMTTNKLRSTIETCSHCNASFRNQAWSDPLKHQHHCCTLLKDTTHHHELSVLTDSLITPPTSSRESSRHSFFASPRTMGSQTCFCLDNVQHMQVLWLASSLSTSFGTKQNGLSK